MPFLPPNQQHQSTEGMTVGLVTPKQCIPYPNAELLNLYQLCGISIHIAFGPLQVLTASTM